jgi:cytochrome P450 / NADPH-cytochrome P450 reductase
VAKTFNVTIPTPVERAPLLDLEILEDPHPNPFADAYKAVPMVVTENRELNGQGAGRSVRHIELVLPEGWSYQPGDHLGVIAENSAEEVARVAARFELAPETRIRLTQKAPGKTALPLDRVVSVGTVLAHYVELHETAARSHLGILAGYARSPVEKQRLDALAADEAAYGTDVHRKNRTLIDLVEDFPSVRLPFARYLELVPPLRPRYYSISSSPLVSGRILSISVGVVSAPARSGHGIFKGSTSSYLAGVARGQGVEAFLQEAPAFHLPGDASLPIILIGAGTGLAPFRGFLQDRAARKASGQTVGKALLFFGCRHAEHDYIYRDELQRFVEQGVVTIFTAFSRQDPAQKVYVQDRVLEQGDLVWQTLQEGGALYVCGDASGMSAGVRKSLQAIVAGKLGLSADEAGRWLDDLARDGRYALDVWASD